MALVFDKQLAGNDIYPVQSKLEFEVLTDAIIQQLGVLGSATLVFQDGTINDGDYFEILGERFTFKTAAVYAFDIQISNYSQHASDFEDAVNNSVDLFNKISLSKITNLSNVTFAISMKKATSDIEVVDFSGGSSAVVLTNLSTFVPLLLKDKYLLTVSIVDDATNEKINDFYKHFYFNTNDDITNISDAVAKFDISEFIDYSVEVIAPNPSRKVEYLSKILRRFRVKISDNWTENNLSVTGFQIESNSFYVLNAVQLAETEHSILDEGSSSNQSFYHASPSGFKIPKKAQKWIYAYIESGRNLQWQFRNENGTIIYSENWTAPNTGFYQISLGLFPFETDIINNGVKLSDIKSVRVFYLKTGGTSLTVGDIFTTFDYENCNSTDFVFLSSAGTYETIALETILTTKNIIERIKYTFANDDLPTTIQSTSQELHRANFKNKKHYGTDEKEAVLFILDFLNSREKYWYKDNKLIKIESVTTNHNSFSKNNKLTGFFEWKTERVYSHKK